MVKTKDWQEIVNRCNQECQECMDDYRKAGVDFSYGACHVCQTGQELHYALMMVSDAEKAWGAKDWNSSKLKEFYHG